MCVVDALATVVDPESQTLLWLALPAVAIAFAAFARSESRDWGRPLASGHQLVLVFWPHVGVPAYLLSTTQRRSLVLTFGLVVVLLLHALWPMLASAGLVRLVLGGG